MGDIKTKKRNHMKTQKLRDTAFIKTELRRVQAEKQTARMRLKRWFGNSATAPDKANAASTTTEVGVGRIEDEEEAREAEDSENLNN
jgi:hypothetical protein